MTGVDFVLVDEFSMASQDMLGLISARRKQAVRGRIRDENHDGHPDVSRGLSIILVGDCGQLPPVGAKSMWKPTPSSTDLSVQRIHVWLAMNNAVELTQVMRQLGPEQAAFRDTLLRIAKGTRTRDDWVFLQQTYTAQVGNVERDSFQNAFYIFPTNDKADERCTWSLPSGTPTQSPPRTATDAEHTVHDYGAVTADSFRGLQPHLFLAVGACVFVNSNVWTSAGLANGTVGEIVHMQWAEDSAPPTPLEVVWVSMENYRGP
ncbi:unnamed protein product [Pylaiella littoralis]